MHNRPTARKTKPKYKSLLDYAIWRKLEPYVRVTADGNTKKRHARLRIEFSSKMPPKLARRALQCSVPCAACGRPMYPVRHHASDTRLTVASGMYYAACCELLEDIACSRTRAARDAYERFRKYLKTKKNA